MKLPALVLVLAACASASRAPAKSRRPAAGGRVLRSRDEALLAQSEASRTELEARARLAAARANRQRGTDFRDPCSGLAMTQEDWEPFINERSPDPFPKPYNVQPMHYATGYFHIGCIVDSQRDQTRWYHDNVPKLDRLGMTPAECFGFCRNVSGALFFGLKGGDKCYCTPFSHNTDKGGRGMCDVPCTGDSSMTCGGKEMIDMYEMHDCNNLPELKCTRQPPPVKHAQMFKSIYYRPASICANAMSEAVTDRKPHCDVQCESGYELLKNTIQCVEKGNRLTYSWAEFEGSAACTPVVCGVPPEGVLSSRSPMPRHYPQKTLYGCFFGHSTMPHLPNASGPKNFTIKCQANATFSPIRECSRVHCGACPSRPHAEAREAGLRVYEDSCTYDCHSGYTIDQNAAGLTVWRGKCHANGQFTTMHQCKPVKCPGQRQVEHAEIVYDDTGAQQNIVFPMMVHYRCQEGYTRNGVVGAENAFTRECQADGILSLPDPECIRDGTTCAQCLPVSCGDPAEVANASYSPQARVYKEKLIYSCNRGYSLDGQAGGPSVTVLTCQSDGTYDAPPPVCVPVECGASPAHPNAEVQGSPGAMIHFESQPLLFKCLPGFSTEVGDDPYRVQKDSYSISCTSSGQFSAYTPCVNINNCLFHSCGRNGDCEDLPAPTGTPLDDYRCKCWPGYETTLSTAGNFTEKICTNIDDCPRPEPPDEQPCGGLTEEGESRGECVDHILGYTCTCYNGYELHNATPTNETCMPVVCGPVPKPNFTTHDFALAEADYDSPAWNYTCDEGYSLSGAYGGPLVFSMGCNSGGKFDPQPGVCLPVTCGAAPVLDFCDSTEQALEMVFPETASYRCNEGYSLTAKYSRADADISFWIECLSDGNFSIRGSRYGASRPALCLPVECGIPTLVANAYHADDTEMFVYPQTARQICAEGHSLDNSTALAMQQFEVQCLSDGTFSDPPEPGQCVPVACPALVPKPNMTCDTTAKVYQQEAECTADAGFTLDGTASGRTSFKCLCQANATFTPVQPVLPVSCGPAPNYTDKFASGPQISFVYSQVASYSCFTGYSLDGTAGGLKTFQIGCQANGAFDEHAGCQPINCGAWELLPHTHQIPDWSGEEHSSLVYGQVAALQCSPGWSTDGALASTNTNGTIACQADGTLLYPKICHSNNNDCGGSDNQCLPSGTCHDHRQPTGIHFDDFSCLCSSGFAENTSAQRKTCYNIPDCPAAACQPGFCTDLVNDYSCTCPRGYYEGPNTEEDLRHDCLPVSCGVPRRIAYSSVSSGAEQFFGGPDLLYTCEPGYTTDGRADGPTTFGSICLSNGTGPERGTQSWTPSCLPVECGTAPVVGNSTHGFAADHVFKYPEELKYTCDTYYQLASASATASPAPPQVTTWILSGGGESCDEACSASGSSCDASADWPTTEAAVSIVGSLLGHSCDQSTNYGGDWEFAPYTYTPDGRCNYPTSATYPTCSAAGADANIRRFCPCTPTVQASSTFVARCAANGTFVGVSSCAPMPCGAVPEQHHVNVNHTGVVMTYGQQLLKTCKPGYALDKDHHSENAYNIKCVAPGTADDLEYTPQGAACTEIDCGPFGYVLNAAADGETRFLGKMVVTCNKGYSLDGSCGDSSKMAYDSFCMADGSFSRTGGCQPVRCGVAPNVTHADQNTGMASLVYMNTAKYTIQAGYTLCEQGKNPSLNTFDVTCESGGEFGPTPSIYIIQCGTAPERENAVNPGADLSYQDEEQYTCSLGHTLDGLPSSASNSGFTLSCNAEGGLDGHQGGCTAVKCGSVVTPQHSMQVTSVEHGKKSTLYYQDQAHFECDPGYSIDARLLGAITYHQTCLVNGSISYHAGCFNINDCEANLCEPSGTCVDHESPTGVHSDDYHCECSDGFKEQIKSDGKRYCGNIPDCPEGACEPGKCKDLVNDYTCECPSGYNEEPNRGENLEKDCMPQSCGKCADHASIAHAQCLIPSLERFYDGEKASYECETGYSLDGTVPTSADSKVFELACQANGKLEAHPGCLPIWCGAAPRVPNSDKAARATQVNLTYGQTAKYICNAGYSVTGDADAEKDFTVECDALGKIGPTKSCKPIKCPVPNVEMPFGEHVSYPISVAESLAFPNEVVVTCSAGYSLDPLDHNDTTFAVKCGAAGAHIFPARSTCQPIDCSPLPAVQNADVAGHSTFGQHALATAHECWSLDGSGSAHMKAFNVSCSASGAYVGVQAFAQISCGAAPSLGVGYLRAAGEAHVLCGTSATYLLDDCYTLSAEGTPGGTRQIATACQDDGNFAEAEPVHLIACGEPPPQKYASLAATAPAFCGTVVEYKCDYGHSLDASPAGLTAFTTECSTSGAFVGESRCQPIQCKGPSVPENAEGTTKDVLIFNETVSFVCKPGFSTDGASQSRHTIVVATCRADGTNSFNGSCINNDDCSSVENDCSPNGECVDRGEPTGVHFDDFSCNCNSGFEEEVNASRKYCSNINDCPKEACQPGVCVDLVNGYSCTCPCGYYAAANAANRLPEDCLLHTCGQPPVLANSDVASSEVFALESASYACHEGHTVDGTALGATTFAISCQAECGADSEAVFSPNDHPGCEKVLCGPAPTVDHATSPPQDAESRYGDSVIYTCESGYTTAAGDFTFLSLDNAVLGNADPLTGAEVLHIGQYGTPPRWLDAVVQVTSAAFEPPLTGTPKTQFSIADGFASLGSNVCVDIKATISFRDHETKEPVTLGYFSVSVFDLDSRANGRDGTPEAVEILTTACDAEEVITAPDADYSVTDGGGGCLTFTSTSAEEENPTNPNELTDGQKRRSVGLTYTDKSSIYLGMNFKCSDYFISQNPSKGRQLMFSFESSMTSPSERMEFDATCGADGNWAGAMSCSPVQCAPLDSSLVKTQDEYGTVATYDLDQAAAMRYGSPLTVTCSTGYVVSQTGGVLINTYEIQCDADGQLVVPKGQECRPVDCGSQPELSSAFVAPESTEGRSITYVAHYGYSTTGTASGGKVSISNCTPTAEWSVPEAFFRVQCPSFPAVDHARSASEAAAVTDGAICDEGAMYEEHGAGNEHLEGNPRTDAQSTDHCSQICVLTSNCTCFSFDGDNKLCYLHTACTTMSSRSGASSGRAGCHAASGAALLQQPLGRGPGEHPAATRRRLAQSQHGRAARHSAGPPPARWPVNASAGRAPALHGFWARARSRRFSRHGRAKQGAGHAARGAAARRARATGARTARAAAGQAGALPQFGDAVTYTCGEGYRAVLGAREEPAIGGARSFTLSCDGLGSIGPSDWRCAAISCPIPAVEGGQVEIPDPSYTGSLLFGSSLPMHCDAGYSLDGHPSGLTSFTETCQDDGTFSADIECIAIDWCETDQCGQFGECVNGQLSYTCSCHEGYESVPVADGSHSTCAEIDECDTMAGHTACDAGQNLGSCVDGHLGYSCMCGRGAKNISGADGRPGCAAMSCETVPARMFQSCAMQGIKISYAQSTQYACDPGYSLDAQPLGPSSYTVSCNLTADEANVELRGFQDCLPVFCGSLPEVEHANSSLANLSYGQSATYTCEQGFSTGGDADSPKEFTVSCTACGSLSSLGECKIISCGHLPSVSFSTATEAELFYKDVGKYECDEGHTISGQPPHVSPSYFEAACQADGTFYGIKNCQPVTCGVPTPANHSLNTPTAEVLYGEEFEVTCESGYTVDADHMGSNHFIVGCNAEGDFTNELKCLPVSCGVPQETDTEISSDPEKFYGELAHWECKDGYSTSGLPFGLRGAPPLTTLSRQCGPSGLFGIASPGECVDIDYCSTNPCTHNGVCTDLGEGLHSPGYECECGEGYEAATDAAGGPTCTEDDCAGDPCGAGTCTDLSKQGGDDGTYSCTCDFGYELTEPVVGRPTCTHLVCGTLAVDSPSNVMMDLIKGIPQVSVSTWLSDATELDMYTQTPILKAFDVATYTCQHGYSADGSNNPDAATISITCNELGIWSRSMDHTFKCVRKMCDNLATGSLAHSELINEKVPWLYGDVAEFRCDTGHTITGEVGAAATFQIECGADGFSSSRVQGCQPVGCLVPTHPLASPTHTGTILYGQAITYTCDSGAGVQGSSSLTSYSGQCEADGTIWAGTDRCQLVSCGVATVPNNAALKVVSATYAEKGSGECDTEMVLYSGRAADQVECEVRCSQSALCAFYTYSSTWPNCILASECDSLAGSTGQTWTKQPQEFYTLDAGSCCCPADERIGTEEECAEAVAAIGFSGLGAELNTTHNPLYPGGCSYHAKTLVGHFNSQLTGIGAMDQVQVCKRPVCADAHLSMGDASIDGDLANLGNYRGSESLAAEIRYTNVGQFLGTNLDVVLTTPTWAMPAREDPDEPPFYKYVFGRLPAAHGLEYEITFEFQDHITHEPVVLSEFDVTFFDLDGDDYGMETLKTSGYTEIFQFQNSEVQLTEMRDGSLLAEGTVKNAGDGTPVADDSLTEKQAQKSIAFRYKDTSSFKITMGMTGGTGAASEWCRYFIWTFESAMVTRPPCAEYTPPPAPLVPVPAGYSSTFGSAPLRVVCDEGTFVGGEVGGATYYTMSCGSDGNFFASSQQVCEEILYSVAGQGTDAQDEDVKLAGAVLKWSRDGAVVATTTVDQSGEYSALLGPGTYTVVAELDGYITMTKEVAVLGEISVGSIGDFALSKILALGEWRVVLEWGDRPSDLDSWTYFGTDHSKNVKWYGKSASDPVSGIEVTLDRDDVTAIGPETTTIKNADKCVGEDACLIWFEVNNYAYWDSTTMDQAQGVVTVYHGDNTAAVYKIPECIGSATLWYTALTIDIRQGHSEVYEGFRQTPPSLVASTSTWATNNGLPGNSVYYASENSWLKLDSSRVLFAARTNDGSHRRRYVSRAVYHEISNGQDCDGCCQEVPIDLSLEGSWGTCPSGFYMSGLYRQERGRPDMYVALYCCRQKQMPEAHGSCVETEWVISNSQSMVTCPTLESGELTAMVGWYRGTSEDVLESITKVRCCAFPEMPLELAADMPGTCENPAT